MKLTAILLMIACLQVSATGFSQMITLSEKNAPLVKVLDKIEQQSGYTFAYTGSMLRKAKKISVNIQNGSLEQALKLCFNDQPFTFAIIEKTIVIKPVVETVPIPEPVPAEAAPPIEVQGVVTDETGIFLTGATVKLKGSDKGTSTDAQGNFSIQLPENGGRLLISYVGYETIEMPVSKSGSLKIVMKLTDLKMEEVVVVAYGTQKKVNLTGAVGSAVECVGSKRVLSEDVSGKE